MLINTGGTDLSKSRKHLYIFILVSLSCGWIGVLIDNLLSEQPEGNSLGMGLWLISPFLVSLIFHKSEHDWSIMGFKPYFSGNTKWYCIAILIYPFVTLVCMILAKIFNCINLSNFTIDEFVSVALITVLGSFIKNIFEEFSWRGYLTPKLIESGLNDWTIYLVSGLVWGLWHSAYYMVFLPDDYFQQYSRPAFLIIACVLMIVWSIMFVEIYRLTKSVWPCVLMHVIEDAVPTVLVTTGEFVSFTQIGASIFDCTTGVIATVLFLTIGLTLRYYRVHSVSTSRL